MTRLRDRPFLHDGPSKTITEFVIGAVLIRGWSDTPK